VVGGQGASEGGQGRAGLTATHQLRLQPPDKLI
jgi:hypothetical protein